MQKVLRKARKGTSVICIPGNHDEAARQSCHLTFGDVPIWLYAGRLAVEAARRAHPGVLNGRHR